MRKRSDVPYTPQGYIDMGGLLHQELSTFIWITGARGGGKTYGAIEYALRIEFRPFILMRRTQVQADFAGAIETTPLAANLREGEYLEQVRTGAKNLAQINVMKSQGEEEPELVQSCYILALSTVSSMRGIDLSQCGLIIYDEFIKEPHERPIKNEWDAFKNAYETLNRNRELQGFPPMRVVALSNALDLGNPYYRGMGLVNEVYHMKCEIYRDPKQDVTIVRPHSRDFSKAKLNTALYRLSGADKTLGNTWAEMDTSQIRSRSLKGSTPICSVDSIGFYKINGKLYASASLPAGSPSYKMEDVIDVAELHKKRQGLISKLFNRDVEFESVDIFLRCRELVQKL